MAISTPTDHGITDLAGTGTTITRQPASTIPVGDHVILIIGTSTTGATVSSISDTKGNTYQVDHTENSSGRGIVFASAKVTTQLTTGDTITVTYGGTYAQRMMRVLSVNGLASTSWKDQGAGASGSGTAPSSGNVVTTQADELLIGAERNLSAGGAITWGGSFTSIGATQNQGSGQWQASAYRIVSATGTYAAAGTIASAGWGAAIVTYKGATGASPVDGPVLDLISDLRAEANGPILDALWDLRAEANSLVLDLPWDLAGAVDANSLDLIWDAIAKVNSAPLRLLADLRAERDAPSLDLIWDVRTPADATALELAWDLLAQVNGPSLDLVWDLIGAGLLGEIAPGQILGPRAGWLAVAPPGRIES